MTATDSQHSAPIPSSLSPGRFTRVSVQTAAGEIEARLSDFGNWELRVRRDGELAWRHACSGNVESGAASIAAPDLPEEDLLLRGPLKIHPAARRATVNGIEVPVVKMEFSLLLILAAQPDRVFGKADLCEALWGDREVRGRSLNSHASRLRCKLRSAGIHAIVNCWGIGYRYWDRTDLAEPLDAPQPSTSTPGAA